MESENYVAKLNLYAQKKGFQLKYEDVGSVGPDHIKTFTLRAVLNGKAYPDGVGRNKKEAKQKAAKNVLINLPDETVDPTKTEASAAPVLPACITQTNYISWLNEYGQKHRLKIEPVESTKLGPSNTETLCYHFVVGGKEYPAATGGLKREAKEEAAKLVYQEIWWSKNTETGEEKSVLSGQTEESLNPKPLDICDKSKSGTATDEGFKEINFIGLVNHYCQKTKLNHDYVFEKRSGPPHNPRFFYKVTINNKSYPVAEGKSVKEAKQNAAQLVWTSLQEQSDWDSKLSFSSAVSDDASPPRSSIPSSALESHDSELKGVPPTASDSVVFADSPGPSKEQIQSPVVKGKRRIAANFQHAPDNSKEDPINFNGVTPGAHDKSPPISRFTSEYDCIASLGNGAFGLVFKAKQKLLDRYFAVKIVRCKKKSLREVAALSDLQHCNIIRYYTCWLEDCGYQGETSADSGSSSQSTGDPEMKYLYIQMELCDTKTLRLWIDEKNSQNRKKSLRDSKRRDESLDIAKQIVCGVEYFHGKKLIHRDLKPANIMFGKDGNVKIGDFGLVTDENDDDAESLMERTVYKGTPSYMAPEQKNRITYDRKVDIFALGLIYFELCYNIPTSHERKYIWDKVRNREFPEEFLPNFPLENQIIQSMLSLKPEDRPEAGKLKKDLEWISERLTNTQRDSMTV